MDQSSNCPNVDFAIVESDPSLESIVPPGARLEKLAGGFGFTEGPIWIEREGCIFSDIPNDTIRRWGFDGRVTDFLGPQSGVRGPNGLTLDLEGRLIICEQGGRRVTRRELGQSLSILAERFEGKQLNSPNDCVHRSDGSLYFTDPPFGLPHRDQDPEKELSWNGIYRLKDGHLELLSTVLTRPNGLAFSPDEKYLYVANSELEQKLWLRFDVRRDGTLSDRAVFYDASYHEAAGLPDGLKVDIEGNLYCTGPGGIWIFASEGKHLGTLITPEVPANCHWGGEDAKTLYITARTSLYRIRLNIAGLRPITRIPERGASSRMAGENSLNQKTQ
jgi:gluconolactonase